MNKTLILIIIILCLFVPNHIMAFIFANESGGAYEGQGTGETIVTENKNSNEDINQLLVLGGSGFIKSLSNYSILLNQIELSSISVNYLDLQKTISESIAQMEIARNIFFNLKQIAESTPYKKNVIYKLVIFNYDLYKNKYNLIQTVFKKVKRHLSTGDVTGTYNECYLQIGKILENLYKIKFEIENSKMPKINLLWRVNQQFFELALFGQYIAEVFFEIKKPA